METVLETKNVTKQFAKNAAVDHVSIRIRRGEIYGFIGENGAGKTTLMRMVCGLAEPTEGEITLFDSPDLVYQRQRIGCTIENPALYPQMTALENMETQKLLLGIKSEEICNRLLQTAGLDDTGSKKAKDFSLGMKQRLMIALAMLGEPEFLVLDEPTNGLDPVGIKEVRDLLLALNKNNGLTILVSSHILGELEKIASCYGVISHGRMVDEFQASELEARCGQNLLLYTNNNEKACQVLKSMYGSVKLEHTDDAGLRLPGRIKDAGVINTEMNREGLVVNTLMPEGQNLEDYFMNLMGGKQNVQFN